MSRSHYHHDAFWTVVSQIIITAFLSLIVWPIWNLSVAGSFLTGGIICVLPNIYFYRRVFAFFGARQADRIVKAFYWGESMKLLLTATGFWGALLIPWILPTALFIGFIAAQGAFWIGPIVTSVARIKNSEKQKRLRFNQ